jgi:hypothetical protein
MANKPEKRDFSQIALDVVRKATQERNPLLPAKHLGQTLASTSAPKKTKKGR